VGDVCAEQREVSDVTRHLLNRRLQSYKSRSQNFDLDLDARDRLLLYGSETSDFFRIGGERYCGFKVRLIESCKNLVAQQALYLSLACPAEWIKRRATGRRKTFPKSCFGS
jgi:hypothetical protein